VVVEPEEYNFPQGSLEGVCDVHRSVTVVKRPLATLSQGLVIFFCINPLPSLMLQSAQDLNIPCWPKRSCWKKHSLSAHAVRL
jgi:hypothetical protein